jgi:multiple sugar transport system permease protein
VAILVLFMVVPIFLALYVSFTNWSGLTSPFSHSVQLVGLTNYRTLITRPGLYQTDFATSIRDNFYFFLFTVPLQTVLALWLANLVNGRFLRAKGFFRTAFYFPSVTSSIAITIVFIFLFQGDGVVNTIVGWFGVKGPDWMGQPYVHWALPLELGRRAFRRHVRAHHPACVDDVGDVHAVFPGRHADHRGRSGRGQFH